MASHAHTQRRADIIVRRVDSMPENWLCPRGCRAFDRDRRMSDTVHVPSARTRAATVSVTAGPTVQLLAAI